jgi:hypothetical protein
MEFLKTIKKRSFINEAVYVALNIGMAVALMLIVRLTGSLWLAFSLVLLGKWRLFAVRPRFWFAHIQSNLVSIIVSMSYVIFLYVANSSSIGASQSLIIQIVLVLLDIAWLVLLKPQSKRVYVVAQAGVALLSGVTAVAMVSYSWIASPVVLLYWLVGYATSHHIISSYDDETHIELLSLSWALVLAEISWLAYHWTIAYKLPLVTGFLMPQISIIAVCFAFLAYKSYDSYYHHQKIRFNDVVLPLVFTVSVVVVLMLFFNSVTANMI